ncbi:mitochondrial Complex I (CI) NADH:ubiquinone oxidoreductase subunit B17.2/N7BM/DAP13/NDUFA12 [Andalucia godoyi]|uniref:NADH dehydrogenase [ubiquinone] 1 alpha subcomplex subunit 12 n=1 Tax=Andalucia godoyi TaxID=505711 RepID=A0A8K0AHH2_ANDGO|nr:mitochondrial Complex I (CI) NADH:ubiquinone oxidoreductase subunit B17.2/N7BM/DAP13/NDUFA12 [Andalucia godoyi]|eukprot:ANDGO_00286.mRNA.1 mitochondrial Complex I (CI) NADH:ubiquinone oxidoreductase subunit B17.2/N7BM/DAP13/NDUFA12
MALPLVRLLRKEIQESGVKETLLKVIRFKDAWFEKSSKRLIGTDQFGNSYYETALDAQLRERFVVPANAKQYDASSIPPEWHNWLHRMTNVPPTSVAPYVPKYAKNHRSNPTGSGNAYLQPAHFLNPKYSNVRNAQSVEEWNPNTPAAQ